MTANTINTAELQITVHNKYLCVFKATIMISTIHTSLTAFLADSGFLKVTNPLLNDTISQ